ncbi:MAG: hypothetical protein HYR85_26885 [Planctomycetes bacterium]|nr:hypothetical protein [Planctomycetota bacterium]MBI3844296.1 hypothetical protein [Planctomycetota bacterium]
MKRLGVRMLLAFVIVIGAAAAWAQDRYVDTASGSNTTGDGSVARPWQTIAFALSQWPREGSPTRVALHVRPGTYEEPVGGTINRLRLRPNVDVIGEDAATTIILTTQTVADLFEGAPPANTRIHIQGLTIRQESTEFSRAFSFEGRGDVEISRCVIENFGNGVYGNGASTWVHDCTIRGTGIALLGVARAERNLLIDNGQAILVGDYDSIRPLITSNTLVGNGVGFSLGAGGALRVPYGYPYPTPYYYWGGTNDTVLEGNTITGGGIGISMNVGGRGVIRPLISNTVIAGCQTGVSMTADLVIDNPSIAPTLSNVTIVGCSDSGLKKLTSYATPTVIDSIVFSNSVDFDRVTPSSVSHCDVGDPALAGTNGNISADPQFVDPANGNYRLLSTSPCIEAGINTLPDGSPLPYGLDLDGRVRDFDADGDGVRQVDIGALEHVVGGLGCRYGNVDGFASLVPDVLRVNGNVGDSGREVTIAAGTPITIEVASPPSDPNSSAAFALFAFLGVPSSNDVSQQPARLGAFSFPTPLTGGSPLVVTLFDNLAPAAQQRLGAGRLHSHAAPFSITLPGSATQSGRNFTLQGFIANAASRNGAFAITNAVVVRVP